MFLTVMIEISLLLNQYHWPAVEEPASLKYSMQPLNTMTLCLYLKQFEFPWQRKSPYATTCTGVWCEMISGASLVKEQLSMGYG